MKGPCEACEELLQGYLDRELSDDEVPLRTYVRTSAAERMPPGLLEKLAQLRTTGPGTSPI